MQQVKRPVYSSKEMSHTAELSDPRDADHQEQETKLEMQSDSVRAKRLT